MKILSKQFNTKIKKIIGIVSGKGGVGKSLVTSLLAVAMNKKGYKTVQELLGLCSAKHYDSGAAKAHAGVKE